MFLADRDRRRCKRNPPHDGVSSHLMPACWVWGRPCGRRGDGASVISRRCTVELSAQSRRAQQLSRTSIRVGARSRRHHSSRAACDRAPVNAVTICGFNKRRTSLRQMPNMARPAGCRWRRAIAGRMPTPQRRRASLTWPGAHARRTIVRSRTEQGPALAPIRRCRLST